MKEITSVFWVTNVGVIVRVRLRDSFGVRMGLRLGLRLGLQLVLRLGFQIFLF